MHCCYLQQCTDFAQVGKNDQILIWDKFEVPYAKVGGRKYERHAHTYYTVACGDLAEYQSIDVIYNLTLREIRYWYARLAPRLRQKNLMASHGVHL